MLPTLTYDLYLAHGGTLSEDQHRKAWPHVRLFAATRLMGLDLSAHESQVLDALALCVDVDAAWGFVGGVGPDVTSESLGEYTYSGQATSHTWTGDMWAALQAGLLGTGLIGLVIL